MRWRNRDIATLLPPPHSRGPVQVARDPDTAEDGFSVGWFVKRWAGRGETWKFIMETPQNPTKTQRPSYRATGVQIHAKM